MLARRGVAGHQDDRDGAIPHQRSGDERMSVSARAGRPSLPVRAFDSAFDTPRVPVLRSAVRTSIRPVGMRGFDRAWLPGNASRGAVGPR